MSDKNIRVPALEVKQGGRTLYSFVVDGKRLGDFAAVSRIRRGEAGEIFGYQRPEVLSHIAGIRSYLECGGAVLPNALVVAFDPTVRFEPAKGTSPSPYARAGDLVIPLRGDDDKPGFLVDGQQRAAAVRDAALDCFPVCVVGFVAENEQEQREQFILVNSTKPLPKSLIYELLPGVGDDLPQALAKRKLPSLIAQQLNADQDSPFCRLIRMPTNPDGLVQDNTVMKMIERSLSDGALWNFRDRQTGEVDLEATVALLKDYWSAVARTFPDAWGKSPRQSRLSHGAGIQALGFIMDASCDRHREQGLPTYRTFLGELLLLKPHCRWTEGEWDFGMGRVRKWNEVQNIGSDARMLSDHLLALYKEHCWKRGGGKVA